MVSDNDINDKISLIYSNAIKMEVLKKIVLTNSALVSLRMGCDSFNLGTIIKYHKHILKMLLLKIARISGF